MSRRAFRRPFRFSAPLLLASFVLAGCGSGGGGSADLDEGGSVGTPPPPATVTDTFDFAAPDGTFVLGTPPIHARFTGGVATGDGVWVIDEGQTGVVDFGTPADGVKFTTQDAYTAAAVLAARKSALPGAQAVSPPFDVPLYIRGTVNDDWAAAPPESNRLVEVSDNVLAVTIPVAAAGTYAFKVADGGWTGETNCGGSEKGAPVTLGVPFTLGCSNGSQDVGLVVATAGNYKFTFNTTDTAAPTITVALDTGGGGGGGGGEPEDSTIIRVYVVDPFTDGAESTLLEEYPLAGTGALAVDEVRQGGATRISRIEIENTGANGKIAIPDFAWTANPEFAPDPVSVDVYYTRPAGSTDGTTITVAGEAYECAAAPSGIGCIASGIPVLPYANASMTVNNADGTSETITFNGGDGEEDVYAYSGGAFARTGVPGDPTKPLPAVPRNANEVVLFYKRPDDVYTGWGLHLFPAGLDSWTTWEAPYAYEGIDPQYGAYFRIALPGVASPAYSNNPAAITEFPQSLGFIIHNGDTKDPGPDQFINIADTGNSVFVVSGVNDVGTAPPAAGAAALRVSNAAAHWVDQDTVLWTPPAGVTSVKLLFSPDASLNVGLSGISGTYETIGLTPGTNPQPLFNKLLHGLQAWDMPASAAANARNVARGQLVVIGYDAADEAVAGSYVQTNGALDVLYAEGASGATLGVSYASGAPSLALWAPTALVDPGVTVNVYDAEGNLLESTPMALDEASGVWSVTGDASWDRRFYTYSLDVYSYAVNGIVTNEVSDPYAVSLSTDGVRSQFVDLDDDDLKPTGWDAMSLPALAAPEDSSIYELHVRDFSIKPDPSLNPVDAGKFTAFADANFVGMQHLQQLADAGLTHVHILPAFDFATVAENEADQVNLDDDVQKLCDRVAAAASLCTTDTGKTIREAIEDAIAANQLDRPQQIVGWMRGVDGFNWGYDPQHYGAPEGSYSTNPNGETRIKEFRMMVKGLNDIGLRTVMDVVYNHTNASGQGEKSVLDKVVPGYYHRRDVTTGSVLAGSCCADTAPEFAMMNKLIVDTGVRWVQHYKVSSFRFDLMGMHPLDAMLQFRDAVQAVEPTVYIYGEGWNCCGGEDDVRFKSARQVNLAGTGIGSFSDRMRDTVRGGGPFDTGNQYVQNQGFVNGWFYDPNALNSGSTAERAALIAETDNIRVFMAGGLASYSLVNAAGETVTGAQIEYRGSAPSGYTSDPQEAINYVEKHDNQTLWDLGAYKHPTGTSTAERVRSQNVAMSVLLLGQGVPFLHAGMEMLRSKSGDRDSYDSGDWFNELDWTMSATKWAQGLPVADKNSAEWPILVDKYLDVTTKPMNTDIQDGFEALQELLQIRTSSPLFRLRTQAQIDQRVMFHNTGPFQIPGVIAMSIEGCTEPDLTPSEGAVMVVVNASDDDRTLNLFGGETWTLHPVQQTSTDAVVRAAKHDANGFFVPARTTAVFRRTTQTSCAPFPRDIYVRGIGEDWSDSPANKFVFKGGTLYEVTKALAVGADPEGFKIADSNWTSGSDCGATTPVVFGQPLTLACQAPGNGNIGMTVGAAGDYVFQLDAASTTNPVLTVSRKPTFAVPIFVRGVGTDWSDSAANQLHPAVDSATYSTLLNIPTAGPDADGGFKIADQNWTSGTDCGSSTPLTLGQTLTLACASPGNANIAATWPSTGMYSFRLDTTNPAAPSLTVEKTPFDVELYVRGIGDDWSDSVSNRFQYVGGGVYQARRAATQGADDFKIADSNWTAGSDCGAISALTIGQPLTLACAAPNNANITVNWPASGTYTFSLDANNPAAPLLTVTGP
jgi:pullulanase